MAESKRSSSQSIFDCKFELDKPQPVYFAGETISGKAIVTSFYVQDVRDFDFGLKAIESVQWEEKEKTEQGYESKKYKAYKERNIMSQPADIISPSEYGFKICLPSDCSPSCEDRFGQILYEIFCSIKINKKKLIVSTKPVSVMQFINLNRSDYLMLYDKMQDTKVISTQPRSTFIAAYLRTPICAYTSGQTLEFQILIDFASQQTIVNYVYNFRKNMTFHAKRKSRTTISNLISKSRECFKLNQFEKIIQEAFVLPAMPSTTNMEECLININYDIQVFLEVESARIELILPVFVGTYPIISSLSEHLLNKLPNNLQSKLKYAGPEELGGTGEMLFRYNHALTRNSIKPDDDDLNFKPFYSVFAPSELIVDL